MIFDSKGQVTGFLGLSGAVLSASLIVKVQNITALFRPAAPARAPPARVQPPASALPKPHFGTIPTRQFSGTVGRVNAHRFIECDDKNACPEFSSGWEPVFVKKSHDNKELERAFDSIKCHHALAQPRQTLVHVIPGRRLHYRAALRIKPRHKYADFSATFAPIAAWQVMPEPSPRTAPQPAFGLVPVLMAQAPAASSASSASPVMAVADDVPVVADPPIAEPITTAVPAPMPSASPPTAANLSGLVLPPAKTSPALSSPVGDLPPKLSDPGKSLTSPSLSQGAPKFIDDDALILQIEAADGALADTIDAYGTRAGVYLPLGVVARFLDLAIKVSDDGNYASGWVLDEKHTLTLNLRQNSLTIDGKEQAFAAADATAHDGELYLRAARFADLFPLNMAVNLRSQVVTVKTRSQFPFEARLAREGERERLAAKLGQGEAKRWPREVTPYAAISFPISDIELRATTDKVSGTRLEGDMRIAGDIGFMTGQLFLSSNSREGLNGAHLELGRRDPDAMLLGPLKASEYQLGDVSVPALPMGLRGSSGRGGYISNAPLERASVFDKIDFRGVLPDGYEVELYRNNILLESSATPVNGQYEFLHVPVDYGLNIFRFVFYGPQGQKREEVRRISVGDGRLSKGELFYYAGVIQKGANLFGLYGPKFIAPTDFGDLRTTAQLEYGLSAGLTTSLSGSWYERAGGKAWQVTGGVRTGLSGIAIKLDGGYQSDGGSGLALGLGGRIFGLGYTARHAEYQNGFIDEVLGRSQEPLRRASEIDINGAIKLGKGLRGFTIPIAAHFSRTESISGRVQIDADARTSARFGGFLLSSNLNYSRGSGGAVPFSQQLSGTFDLASLNSSKTHYRAAVGYQILPQPRITNLAAEIDHSFDDRTLLRASVTHILGRDALPSETSVGVSAIRRFNHFSLALDGNYSFPNGGYSAVLRLGLSFGRNPITGGMFFKPPGMAAGGAVALRAYRDDNTNARYDFGEQAFSDVTFNTSSQQAVTDKRGLAFIGNLGNSQRTSVLLNTETLPDIAMAPTSRGVEIVPRPGRIHISNFAIQTLGDIEGTAYFAEAGGDREVSGVKLRVLGKDGKAAGLARTEGDGYFLIEQLPPGEYSLVLDEAQAEHLKISLAMPINFSLTSKDNHVRQKVFLKGQ